MAFYNELNDITNFSISFTRTPKYDFGFFAEGYRFAANLVAKELIESARFSDYQAYPVVFLYRHALELQLKNIIYKIAKLLSFKHIENTDHNLSNSHDLCILSNQASGVLTKAFPADQDLHEVMKKVVCVARDFSEIDPISYSYRYPIDNKGRHSTKQNQIVNLQSLATHMDELLSILDVIDFGVNIETHVAQEVYELLENI